MSKTPNDSEARLCAVIGNPVSHSLSPVMHNAAYEAAGLNYVYRAFEVKDVGPFLDDMRGNPNFRGLSVTIPHKIAVMAHLDEVDAMARTVGSVNTITNDEGRLIGSTTDGPGALRAFEEAGVSLAGKRVLFLGTGGAVRGVAFAVAMEAEPDALTILGRTESKVKALQADLGEVAPVDVGAGDLSADIEEAMGKHDVVIQGTPMGMWPEYVGKSPVPAALLRAEHVVCDMVYRPLKTQLLEDAEAAGATVVPGMGMLLHQGALQFERWTGQAAPVDAMRKALVEALA